MLSQWGSRGTPLLNLRLGKVVIIWSTPRTTVLTLRDSTGFRLTCYWTVLEFVEAIKSVLLSRTNSFKVIKSRPVQHYTLVLTLQLHDRLDNKRKMDGQMLPIISFILHNFYFIHSNNFPNWQERCVTAHIFRYRWGLCSNFCHKKFANIWCPPPQKKKKVI